VKLDRLGFEIICFGLIVRLRYHRFVSECKTERNKIDVLWEDIEQIADAGMKNEKKLEKAAELFSVNSFTAFYRMQKQERTWEV